MNARQVFALGEFGYEPVRNQVGELVVRAPWIGMTRGFWRDATRYEQTYWSRFPDVWVHGDWAAIDEDGLWYILGRSDDTIKIAGKRLGPAEVESVLVEHPAVLEAAAIGIPDATKGQALVCFCVLKPGQAESPALSGDLKSMVATRLVEQGGLFSILVENRFASTTPVPVRVATVMTCSPCSLLAR